MNFRRRLRQAARAHTIKGIECIGGGDGLQKAQAEAERLERVLKKIRREVDRESNRDIYGRVMKILNDAHAWAKNTTPKLRTEADFRHADIDQRGYVTFRDGGAA